MFPKSRWTIWLLRNRNYSVRKLGRRWNALHRLVYPAAILTFVHWVLVAFDPVSGLVHAGVLVALETYRVAKISKSRVKKI